MGRDAKAIFIISQTDDDHYHYSSIDFKTGDLLSQTKINIDPYSVLPNSSELSDEQKQGMMKRVGNPFNPMQMAGLFDGKGTRYQGTKLGILKISTETK